MNTYEIRKKLNNVIQIVLRIVYGAEISSRIFFYFYVYRSIILCFLAGLKVKIKGAMNSIIVSIYNI